MPILGTHNLYNAYAPFGKQTHHTRDVVVHYLTRTKNSKNSHQIKINILNLYPSRYSFMFFIEKTIEFDKWLRKLKDLKGKAKILFRIQKLESDEHFGDCKSVGDGIRELRVNFAKGYRVYFKEKDGKKLFY